MKYSNLRAFEKHLASAAPDHFSDIYMILGKEVFERKAALDLLIAAVLKKETAPEMCLNIFEADKHTIQEITYELEAFAFFGKKRLIAIQNIDKFDKISTSSLETYFIAPNRSVCLVLIAPALNRTTSFYKRAEKAGIIIDIAEEKPWEREKSLAEWLRHIALQAGKQLDQQTSQRMIKQLGTEQALLYQELNKLICYVGDRQLIHEKDVTAVCGAVNTQNVWQLGEAIFCGNPSNALRIAKTLLFEGIALIALLRQIRSQFQTDFQVCSILLHGGTAADIMKEFPYMKGQILDKHIEHARSYGMDRFREGLLKIDDAELQAKNSSIDPDLLIAMLMIKLSV